MFTASRLQVFTYLFGVCLFSISFLVFVNSSVSFVITDLIGKRKDVGDAVGTLGFADELVALVACPVWGILSDKIGVRTVCVLGYGIVGLSLFLFVQARNVYPQLLLARLFFSLGGCATATMVTAILPSMIASKEKDEDHSDTFTNETDAANDAQVVSAATASLSSELTITQTRFRSHRNSQSEPQKINGKTPTASGRTSGFVGLCSGCGALLALSAFLPLPARFQSIGVPLAQSVVDSYYIVGSIALVVSVLCLFGFRNLENKKTSRFGTIFSRRTERSSTLTDSEELSWWKLLRSSLYLGITHCSIGLGYLGGFIARASSVGISLFIPLYVNSYFISSGLCSDGTSGSPGDIKQNCRRAYVLAAELTGVSQLVALICAPIFGYCFDRYSRHNFPLVFAASVGIMGYVAFGLLPSPEPTGEHGSPAVFLFVAMMGASQIGAIVCSLSLLSQGVQGSMEKEIDVDVMETETDGFPETDGDLGEESDEDASLLGHSKAVQTRSSHHHLKGSIAGVYSLCGGAGILLLTKLGGLLFDKLSPGSPFFILAIFNGILLLASVWTSLARFFNKRRSAYTSGRLGGIA
ncbi:MAG: hypothetical protein M1834_001679 [Cirrosporium novae-zelandiae]|nr:MAG: hypothetical protein M1834_001679 [Cirrosporium novae-zelandiae]